MKTKDLIISENILKSFSSDGRYVDNSKNRKLNRVGMPYAHSEKEPKIEEKEKKIKKEKEEPKVNWKKFDLDSLNWQGGGRHSPSEAETKFGTLYSSRGDKFIEMNGKRIWLTDRQAKHFAVTGKTKIPYKEDIRKELSDISSALQKSKEKNDIIYLHNPNPNDVEVETLAIYPPKNEGGHEGEYLVVNQGDGSRAFYHSSYGDGTIAKQINRIFKKHDYSDLFKQK